MATLKSLVDETSNIKNELKSCHANLKNNLVDKGVEVSSGDKLSTLVDKVNGIKEIKKVKAGETYTLFSLPHYTDLTKDEIFLNFNAGVCGSLRFEPTLRMAVNGYTSYFELRHYKNGVIFQSKRIEHKTSGTVSYTVDFDNIDADDIIELYSDVGNYALWVYGFSIKYDL